ncbi:SdrD B-like domain-containing protein [Corynebacterium faecium]|uniref:SdrD B-like domain-containing protein n=1 Tax=Corynebacterium faecium TaxID=3016001 RepID=UPI0022B4E766
MTVTPTSTEDCGCEPTTTTKTEKVPVPVPTTVHTTTTAEAPKRGTIGDRVWEDTNGDGVEDPGEKTGIPNVPVVIVDKDGNEVTRTVTDKDGNWKVDVEPGEYTVRYEPGDRTPSDKEQVERTIVIEPGEENFDVDLGILPSGSVGDRVWNDANGDGKQGEDEQGLENVVVLVSREGEPTRSAVTDENGDWKIEGLNPDAEYEVRFIKPEGWEATGKVPGSDESGLISKVTVKPNEYNDSYDLGLKKIDPDCGCEPEEPGTIGDRVWIDENGDGKEDPNEKTGVPGVTVIVKDPDGNEVTRTVTDEDGNWKVDVEPGEYTVRYEPGDRTPSDKEQVERTITIKPGEENFDVDLGILPSGSVGDRVWNDEDGDGEQSEDEKGLENVVVLVSREGEPTRSAVTDENGDWKIEGLNPDAEYEVRFIKPEGWEVTGKVPGSDESGLVSKVTVKPNEYNDSYDLGLKKIDPDCDCEPVKPGTIGDRVWIDLNGNGKQDPNETEGVPDVTVIVRDKDGNEVTRTVTDEDGNWKVNVEPGDYEIEYRPRDWKPTDPQRVTQKVTVEEGKEYLDLDLGVQKPKPGEPTPPTDTPDPEQGSSTEKLDRCVANAVRSPLLYLVPVALLGAFGGEIARPYMGAINEQVNQINAQFQEAMRRNTPDWGQGGRGGRDNDQFAELRGQIDAANRRIAELGQDPNVQRFGTVAAGIIGLIAAGGVLYDWCSNEEGEAFTAVGGSSSKDAA